MIDARLLIVLACGCYQPSVATGVPCSASGDCPPGQDCNLGTNRCELHGGIDAAHGDVALDDAAHDAAIDAPIDAVPLGPWGAPFALASLNSNDRELDPSLTDDGLEIFFASNRSPGPGQFDIYHATRTSVTLPFGAPVLLLDLSGGASEVGPEISGDGLTVYFYRLQGNFDIFTATRPNRTSPFSNPVKDTMLSSGVDDRDPMVTDTGLFAVVDRQVTSANMELWLYSRSAPGDAWGPPRQLTELSTANMEGGGTLDDTGTLLMFHSDRTTQNMLCDLYVATRATPGDPFGPPLPISELNVAGSDEGNPDFSDDLRTLVFDRGDDLYMSTR